MNRDEAIKILKGAIKKPNTEDGYMGQAFDVAIKALEQQACGDAVSRQAVEKITWEEPSYTDALNVLTEVREKIRQLSSVNPQQKTGHWIVHPKGIYAHLICDNCLSNAPYDCRTNYCPDCGAKMVEPQESEVSE